MMRDELTTSTMHAALKTLGHQEFRPGQREAIETLFEKRRLLLVAPTGGGKSLSYQLPALLLDGTTLVISPLVALMADQVRALEDKSIAATYLAATLPPEQMRDRLSRFERGEYKLVYVSPERLTQGGFRQLVRRVNIPLIAVDEAHCICEWGHDFRPEYMQIGEFIAENPGAHVLACTATATPFVRDEILTRLGLKDDMPQMVRGFARPNIHFSAQQIRGPSERPHRVDELLLRALGGPSRANGSAIVYAPTRKMAEEEERRLGMLGWRCSVYHAGLSPERRERTLQGFSNATLDVVVATNAFGMGIDRGDVRAVIHLAPPGSIEAYYQEVGRAGRDGQTAYGLLLTSPSDLPLRRRLLVADGEDTSSNAEVVEHKWNLFLELMRWAQGHHCRQDALLRYFGDHSESMGRCGVCDYCVDVAKGAIAQETIDDDEAELIIRKALSGVARVHGRFGISVVANILKGKSDSKIQAANLDRLTTFGILSAYPLYWISSLLRQCVGAGLVIFHGAERPCVCLTESGRAVMMGTRPARLLLSAPASGAQKVSSNGSSRRLLEDRSMLDDENLACFEALRGLRMRLAREAELPPYVVASDRTLRELALLRPRTHAELMMVHGIGASRAERYGEAFLAELLAYSANKTEARAPG